MLVTLETVKFFQALILSNDSYFRTYIKDSEGKEIASDKPKKAPVIKSVTVETYGVDYGIPETVEEFDMNSWYTNFLMQKYGYSQQ